MAARTICLLCCSFSASAADFVNTNFNIWGVYFGDHPLGASKWGLHLEGQIRRNDGFDNWQQLLLRPGVNYEINKHLAATLGYTFVLSYPYGAMPSQTKRLPEHRIWYQANIKYNTAKISWSTRVRWENRWIGTLDNKFRFENRFRIWQRAVVPVRGPYYLAAYDEVWFYVKPYVSNSVFDQNRSYLAIGRRLGPKAEVEFGYMNQYILQRNGLVRDNNHTLVFAIYSRKRFGK